jgi:hypothetical protein
MRVLLFAMLFLGLMHTGAAQISTEGARIAKITVRLNDEVLAFPDVPPYWERHVVLVPIRHTAEALGARVHYDGSRKTVTIAHGARTIVIPFAARYALVDGRPVDLAVSPVVVQGRQLVPLRFLAEAFGGVVAWDQESLTAFIHIRTVQMTTSHDLGISDPILWGLKSRLVAAL